jgi:YVTN family beta-propeller protein
VATKSETCLLSAAGYSSQMRLQNPPLPRPTISWRSLSAWSVVLALSVGAALAGSPATAAPTDTYAVTGMLNAPGQAEGIEFSPDASRAYVTHGPDGEPGYLGIFDTRTRALLADVQVGIFPVGIAPTSDGTRVYVANNVDDTVSVVDLRTNAVLRTIPVGDGPLGIAATPDGRKVYTSSQYDGSVTVIDGSSLDVVKTIELGEAGAPFIDLSPDGRYAYVTVGGGVAKLDTSSDEIVDRIDGLGGTPLDSSITADGNTLFAAVGDTLFSIDLTNPTRRKATVLPVAGSAWGGLGSVGVTPDGTTAFVEASGFPSELIAVDVASGSVEARFEIPGSAQLVAISPNGSDAYVTSQYNNVTIVTKNPQTGPPVVSPPAFGSVDLPSTGSAF